MTSGGSCRGRGNISPLLFFMGKSFEKSRMDWWSLFGDILDQRGLSNWKLQEYNLV